MESGGDGFRPRFPVGGGGVQGGWVLGVVADAAAVEGKWELWLVVCSRQLAGVS